MATRLLTRQQSRQVDEIAIEKYGIPSLVLMENAGRGVVDVLLDVDAGLINNPRRSVAIFCGKGNNAGDGFVMARHLEIRGVRSKVILLSPSSTLSGDAKLNYHILRHMGVEVEDLSAAPSLSGDKLTAAGSADWFIDAMLGTGATGEPRSPFDAAIDWMNQQPAKRLAVDVPSGLDCDTGQPAAATFRADHTCTFVAAKQGFVAPAAAEFLGQLHIVSIGVPAKLVEEVAKGPAPR